MSELNDDSGLWFSVKGTDNLGMVKIHGNYGEYQQAINNARTVVENGQNPSEIHTFDVNTIAWVAIASAFGGRPHVMERHIVADETRQREV